MLIAIKVRFGGVNLCCVVQIELGSDIGVSVWDALVNFANLERAINLTRLDQTSVTPNKSIWFVFCCVAVYCFIIKALLLDLDCSFPNYYEFHWKSKEINMYICSLQNGSYQVTSGITFLSGAEISSILCHGFMVLLGWFSVNLSSEWFKFEMPYPNNFIIITFDLKYILLSQIRFQH